jgi:HrpA-like RNA helicase
MSATLEAGNFRNYFNQRSAELKLPGRTHPVTTFHTDWITSTMGGWTDSESICKPAVAKVKELHEHERRTPGDILLFLPGEEV